MQFEMQTLFVLCNAPLQYSFEIITVQFAFSRDFVWSNLQKFNNNAFTVWLHISAIVSCLYFSFTSFHSKYMLEYKAVVIHLLELFVIA